MLNGNDACWHYNNVYQTDALTICCLTNTHAHMHAHTHARTHTRTHTHAHKQNNVRAYLASAALREPCVLPCTRTLTNFDRRLIW